jgi:hypothetical protein
MPKYVVSTTPKDPEWNNAHVIDRDIAAVVGVALTHATTLRDGIVIPATGLTGCSASPDCDGVRRNNQQPVGDTGGHEPRHPRRHHRRRTQSALGDRDPLRASRTSRDAAPPHSC